MEKALGLLCLVLLFTSCSEDHFKEDKIFAGGKYVTAKTLNTGKVLYTEYCMPCHGVKGDGKGVASKGMKVPPRDLTSGIYKFGRVLAGDLPHDDDFFKILEHGLDGTAMLPWDLSKQQMNSVVQYIKTFAPDVWEGKDKKLGERITPTKDPYGLALKSSAIEKGKAVYHMVASCQSCHRSYISKSELNRLSQKINNESYEVAEDEYVVKRQDTEWDFTNIPPDFTWHRIRSASTVSELYVRLSAGVAGTAMPSWQETITDDEIWAVAYYVKSLMDLRDSPERKKLMDSL